MDKLQKIILTASLAILAIGVLPVSSVSAVTPNLVVGFEQTPLFNEANFLPGGIITRWVDVTNNTSETKTIGVKAKNYTSCSQDCLADQLKLKIGDGTSDLYGEVSLTDFFAAGEKKLSDLGSGATIRYYFTIAFVPGAENNYQSKQVGFDFDVGIFGQETIGGGGSTGGGGYFGGDTGLTIFNETFSPIVSGQTDITWETNHPATSRVIYSAESESHIFQLDNPPNYGYAHSTVEDSSPVINHSVNIAELEAGVTYYYRVVSRGSFAVSIEHSFTVPGVKSAEIIPGDENIGNIIALNQGGGESGGTIAENNGSAGGEITGGESAVGEVQNKENFNQLFLASLSNLFKDGINFCLIIFLFIVIATILLLLSLLVKRKEEENKERRWILSLATIVVLIILYSLICPYYKALIIVVGILFILFLLFYYFMDRKKK